MDLNQNEEYWFHRDHEEALSINRQLSVAGKEVTSQHVMDLNRFCDCTEDGEGYDVPLERMRSLREVGLVNGGRFGLYETTPAGQTVRSFWYQEKENSNEKN